MNLFFLYLFRIRTFIIHRINVFARKNRLDIFPFSFSNEVIHPSKKFNIDAIEKERKSFLKNSKLIEVINFKTGKKNQQQIKKIAKTSLSPKKFSAFLFHLIKKLEIKKILETGTSLGINTQYLASNNGVKVTTIEGSKNISNLAQQNTPEELKKKISFITGNIYNIFPKTLDDFQPDFIFIDADHRGLAIDFYLEKIDSLLKKPPKCIILHDIYWSRDMNEKWKTLVNSEKFKVTVDFYDFGLIFPNYGTCKKHLFMSL